MRTFTLAKACSRISGQGYGWTVFAEEIRSEIHGVTELCQQKPGIEMRLPRNELWRTLLSNGVDPLDVYRRATWVLKI